MNRRSSLTSLQALAFQQQAARVNPDITRRLDELESRFQASSNLDRDTQRDDTSIVFSLSSSINEFFCSPVFTDALPESESILASRSGIFIDNHSDKESEKYSEKPRNTTTLHDIPLHLGVIFSTYIKALIHNFSTYAHENGTQPPFLSLGSQSRLVEVFLKSTSLERAIAHQLRFVRNFQRMYDVISSLLDGVCDPLHPSYLTLHFSDHGRLKNSFGFFDESKTRQTRVRDTNIDTSVHTNTKKVQDRRMGSTEVRQDDPSVQEITAKVVKAFVTTSQALSIRSMESLTQVKEILCGLFAQDELTADILLVLLTKKIHQVRNITCFMKFEHRCWRSIKPTEELDFF